MDVVLLLLV